MNAQASGSDEIYKTKIQRMMKKEYTNGEITIVWHPGKCQHAGVCARTLPQVYKPKEKPWIQMEHATTQELKDQINQCPSGALSYYTHE